MSESVLYTILFVDSHRVRANFLTRSTLLIKRIIIHVFNIFWYYMFLQSKEVSNRNVTHLH